MAYEKNSEIAHIKEVLKQVARGELKVTLNC